MARQSRLKSLFTSPDRQSVISPTSSGQRSVNWRKLNSRAKKMMGELGVDLDPRLRAGTLPVGQQKIVELVKALSTNPLILILDEVTASLDAEEEELLFSTVNRLVKESSVSVIYISHRIREIFSQCHQVTVFKDGRLVGKKKVTIFGLPLGKAGMILDLSDPLAPQFDFAFEAPAPGNPLGFLFSVVHSRKAVDQRATHGGLPRACANVFWSTSARSGNRSAGESGASDRDQRCIHVSRLEDIGDKYA
jgi:energy-coupling factor transporter ATP-binding protein EcfA2